MFTGLPLIRMLPHVNFAEDSLFTFTRFKYNSKNINCRGSRIKSLPGNANEPQTNSFFCL